MKSNLVTSLFVLIGVYLATLGLKGFLIPNHFIDGGVTGLSMLVAATTSMPLYLAILLINLPFVILGFFIMGWSLPLRGAISIALLSTFLHFIQVPTFTSDPILAALFGGLFLGGGIGVTIRAGSALDGTEIMALILNKHYSVTVGDIILLFNVLLFVSSIYFLGLEIAMYSILTYISAAKAIDFIVTGLDEHISMMIVTQKSPEIRQHLLEAFQKGVTVLKAEGGYSLKNQDVLFCVMTRFDLSKIKSSILVQDPGAFIITHKVGYSSGGLINSRNAFLKTKPV